MVAVNGIDIHYEVEGQGTTIVFVHGLGVTSNVWHAQRMTLSKSYHVIVYDRSGCGRSAKAPNGYSVDGFADELAGLLDHLEVASAIVVGHSLGSTVAQRFASKYARKTKALILAGGEAELDAAGKKILTDRAHAIEADGLLSVVDRWLSAVLSAATREADPALAGLLREVFLANDAETYAAQCLALAAANVRDDHKNIVCPTLLTVGDQDPVTPLRWQQEIGAAIADSRIRVIPFTAHMTMLERPAVFNAALFDFLATLQT